MTSDTVKSQKSHLQVSNPLSKLDVSIENLTSDTVKSLGGIYPLLLYFQVVSWFPSSFLPDGRTLGSQEEPGEARRSQEEPGRAKRRSQAEEP